MQEKVMRGQHELQESWNKYGGLWMEAFYRDRTQDGKPCQNQISNPNQRRKLLQSKQIPLPDIKDSERST